MSLTPNEDRVRAMPVPPGMRVRAAEPGFTGVRARLNLSVIRAQNLAVARELDRGTPPDDIARAFMMAVACGLAGIAIGFGEDPQAYSEGVIDDVAAFVRQTMAAHARGEVQLVAADEVRFGRA